MCRSTPVCGGEGIRRTFCEGYQPGIKRCRNERCKITNGDPFCCKKMACDMECRARGIIAISYLTT